MTQRTAAQVLAGATAALLREHDVTDVLARLMRDCAELLSAQAIGLLMVNGQGALELLSSTSHQVAELETFQIQHDSGPCVDAIQTATILSVTGESEIRARWSEVGAAIVDGGYRSVLAYPMRWHGHVLGALNVYRADADLRDAETELLGQTFADIATIAILQSTEMTIDDVSGRVQHALRARTVIEQAKGVLAYRHHVDMGTAYELLVERTAAAGLSLTAGAAEVISEAQEPGGS